MIRKYKLTYSLEVEVSIDVPEGEPPQGEKCLVMASQKGARELAHIASDAYWMEELSVDLIGPPTAQVPSGAWIVLEDGTKWATDGWCAIREDLGALPDIGVGYNAWEGWKADTWRPSDETMAKVITENTGRPRTTDCVYISTTYRPLLDAAYRVEVTGQFLAVMLYNEGGELVGMVMPLRPEPDVIESPNAFVVGGDS